MAQVHAVPGELTHENCGMTPEWRTRLYSSIEIIMHVAAVVGMRTALPGGLFFPRRYFVCRFFLRTRA